MLGSKRRVMRWAWPQKRIAHVDGKQNSRRLEPLFEADRQRQFRRVTYVVNILVSSALDALIELIWERLCRAEANPLTEQEAEDIAKRIFDLYVKVNLQRAGVLTDD